MEEAENSVTLELTHNGLEVDLVKLASSLKDLLNVTNLNDVNLSVGTEHTWTNWSLFEISHIWHIFKDSHGTMWLSTWANDEEYNNAHSEEIDDFWENYFTKKYEKMLEDHIYRKFFSVK